MAATTSIFRSDRTASGRSIFIGTVTLDASYPTGGYTIDIPNEESFDYFHAQGKGYQFEWDRANQKLLVYQGDNANAAAGPGVQVPNATNLSTITVPFMAYGS